MSARSGERYVARMTAAELVSRISHNYRDSLEQRDVTPREYVVDVLATLRHYADACGVDWNDADDVARVHWRRER